MLWDKLVVVWGMDFSGKGTVIKGCAEYLESQGKKVYDYDQGHRLLQKANPLDLGKALHAMLKNPKKPTLVIQTILGRTIFLLTIIELCVRDMISLFSGASMEFRMPPL